ncbi:alpha-acetolactate decarboxylase [Monoraphidium neglectum]|uniref:Alpha-acetolactate decarboxylase n=1 Tax=Monoraphidium neglectum TaxID=145388 RepID=A0A0D2NUY0_9CHLO|nr:alpha-acetolactate decarboxylase [Monoraphidium neglectum]KIZ07891.1 alpha-acetolactate decarboxylase [Monoraphidium neglectum]|eukprot:XP_013906910.1 alpha-acetolactate decarboxylase [Monoraphidium neglectum]
MGNVSGKPRGEARRRRVSIDARVLERPPAPDAERGASARSASRQLSLRPPSRVSGARLERQGTLLALYVTDPIITLVAGLLKGDHTVAQALTHGDFGLGTLDQLDGEGSPSATPLGIAVYGSPSAPNALGSAARDEQASVVVLDGVAYHQNESGTRVLSGNEPSPFMTVTWFDKTRAATTQLQPAADFAALQTQLLATFRTENCVYAIRIRGKLPTLRMRAVCKQPEGTRLAEAAAKQHVFDLKDEEGDLVGFWCPAYSGPGIQVPGFHLHYISADRARGGHVLQLSLEQAEAQSIEIHRCIVDLPSNEAFMRHDLNMDHARAELHAAEQDH